MTVAILIFTEVEVLDFAGPFEVLNVANRVAGEELFKVFLIAEKKELVVARNGFTVLADHSFDDAPPFENAVRLWQSCGFEIVGRLPDAFLHPRLGYVDALVMHRAL